MAAGFGKCVEILHVMGDTLYNMDKPPVRPKLGPPVFEKYQPKTLSPEENQINEPQTTDNEIHEISDNIDNVNVTEEKDNENENEDTKDDAESLEGSSGDIKEEVLDPIQEMDNLLEYCFLKACKTSLKKGDLPMITSTFFKNHVIGVCPPGKTVDVKKSSYKKLSVFLANLKEKGLVDTSVLKGVESLLAIKVWDVSFSC